MEIRTTRTQTGREMYDEIMARYGDRAGVEAAAHRKTRGDAHDALFWLQAFDEDPSLLLQPVATTTVQNLDAHDVRLLTVTRLELLAKLATMRSASVMDLRRALGRDYKRVQTDVEILERLGAVRSRREGGRRVVEPAGTALTIQFI